MSADCNNHMRSQAHDDGRARVGRFILLEPIGGGAMGEVWAARDPRLDREVALKRLRGDVTALRAKQLREAQALARLAHPNVVSVFEVGVDAGHVYIAMERIHGPSLRAWLADGPPRARVLEVFVQIARGLAAAHAVGLVHRDFKPDNVVVGADGRARVVDFGLASDGGDELAALETSEAQPLPPRAPGTPAYMAPEQFLGEAVDARADQFAYCVAMFEALLGARPFLGATRMALADAITHGRVTLPPSWRTLPRRIRTALLRGLQVAPAQRHADMPALIDALAPPRRPWLIATAAASAITVGVVAWPDAPTAETAALDTCATTAAGGAWTPARREALAVSLSRAVPPGLTPDATLAQLDAWAEHWAQAQREACEATFTRHEQSGFALDRRVACLRGRAAAFDAAVAALEDADATAMRHVDDVLATIPAIDSCADLAFITAADPVEASLRAPVQALQAELARVLAQRALGQVEQARTLAASVESRAASLGHASTHAEALLVLGLATQSAGDPRAAVALFERAHYAALAANADDVAARSAGALVDVIGHDLADDAGAQPWIRHAVALVSRQGVDPMRGAEVRSRIGNVHVTHGRYVEAERAYLEALAAVGLDDSIRADAEPMGQRLIASLGGAAIERGDPSRAQYLATRSLVSAIARWGPDHLEVADQYNNLAAAAFRRGDFGTATALLQRCVDIRRRWLGDDHPEVLLASSNLAGALLGAGDAEGAAARLREIIAGWSRAPGDRQREIDRARYNLVLALRSMGRFEEALPIAEASLAGHRSRDEPLSRAVIDGLLSLAAIQRGLGRSAEALQALEPVIEAARLAAIDGVLQADLQLGAAECQAALGDVEAARATATRALASLDAASRDDPNTREMIESFLAEHAEGVPAGPRASTPQGARR
ncbi:MAG: protein kinase [Nannocystaceae bacterium]|nr:protein kinase [Nannocystaceae bacterium]